MAAIKASPSDVADALQERREIRIGKRNAHGFNDLAANLFEPRRERGFRFAPGAQSLTSVTTRLLPFLAAHSANIQDCGGKMKPART